MSHRKEMGKEKRKHMVLSVLLKLLMALLAAILVYVLVVTIAYRDLDVAELQDKYQYSNLHSVNIDGVELHYQVDGNDNAPVLLLMHSHYFTMRMWDEWIDPLASKYRVIRFDMTTHGLTGPDPSNDYSMARSQQLINGLLDHLKVNKLSIVGSSLGGNMAFTFAANQPQRVDNLVLINSGGLKRENARSGTIPGWVDAVFYLMPRMAFQEFLQWMIADDALVTPALVEEFHDMLRRSGNRVAELNRLRSFKVGDPDTTLAKITAPTLLMWGDENPQLAVALVDTFKQKLSNASIVKVNTYPGVGHVIPLEMPIKGAEDLLQFLQTEN